MADLLGPADAPNAVTSRPTDSRVFPSVDTFFKGCSAPDVDDGTEVQAEFLNGVLQQIRNSIRGMGVTENNADDDMLFKAIQANGMRYAVDTGAANAMVITNARPISAYTAGLPFFVKAGNAVTGAATLNADGVGAKNIKHADGSALVAGDWPAGAVGLVVYDGTSLQLISVAINVLALFAALLTTNGYQKFASGLIMQWGTTANYDAEGGKTITFPIEFPNACLNAQATPLINSPVGANDYWGQVYSLSKTSMGVYMQQAEVGSFSYPIVMNWLAIGY